MMPLPEPQCPSNDPERDAKRRAIAEARADVAAGRVISNADMGTWLESWTTGELPPPSTWK